MSNKLHIVHTEASQGWGGQEIRIINESQGMIARGHKVSLLAPREAKICNAARDAGISVIEMPFEKKSFKNIFTIRKWLLKNRPDVVNTHSSIDSWLVGLAG